MIDSIITNSAQGRILPPGVGQALTQAAVNCTQCLNAQIESQSNTITQPGRHDMNIQVFPWLEVAIGKY